MTYTDSSLPKTLLEHAGLKPEPGKLSESVLVIVDAQRDYQQKLRLPDIDAAVAEAVRVLAKAREAGTPVIHVVQHSKPGSALFASDTDAVEIIDDLQPVKGEQQVIKQRPSSFAGTDLREKIEATGRKSLIVIGFMTHMCVSTTVRDALEQGYKVTVVGSACASRDLPDTIGGVVKAEDVHRAHLAALADRFATVVRTAEDLPL